jgi:2-amino-4-hydroxy-6-hydroxymethyldihydropteridine diphosphokinase
MLVYLGLGSNIGDRKGYLKAASTALQHYSLKLTRSACLYQTEPKEMLEQPWFLNTVIEADTNLQPKMLLDLCMEVERSQNRSRNLLSGPRTLDIDIILYGSYVINTSMLTLPHPRYTNRRFVLEPLAEIAPDFVDPLCHMTIGELLRCTSDRAVVEKVEGPLF